MKKLAISLLLVVMVATGCARGVVDTNLPPLAYIDSVSSSDILTGDNIQFTGHGISTTSEIVAYNWRSSINGDLSTEASFETTELSAGLHTIWFKVQDKYGNWSKEVGTNLSVRAHNEPALRQIRVFTATPPDIRKGQLSTLSWDVSGAGPVRIDPEIGDVSYSGSRAVRPDKDTVYTIFAENEFGTATATAKVTVSKFPVTTLTLYSLAGEDGTACKDKLVLEDVRVGENDLQIQMQGFLSYDISNIPVGAMITEASLDLSGSNMVGDPFPNQGALNIYSHQYGSMVKSNNYMNIVPAGFIYSWNYSAMPNLVPGQKFTSAEMINAVQKQVDERSGRFQMRLQFEKYYYYPNPNYDYANRIDPNATRNNYLDVSAGNPRMIIKYLVPE